MEGKDMDLLHELRGWLDELWPPEAEAERRHARKRQPGGWSSPGSRNGRTESQQASRTRSKDEASLFDRWWDWLAGGPAEQKPKLPYSVRSRRYSRPADPLRRAIDWLTRRSVYTFYVRLSSGWTGPEIQALLRDHGVRIGFRGVLNGDIFFEVPAQQAGLVELLLLKAGVPLAGLDPSPPPMQPNGSSRRPSH
jgi:hypothetical protein